MSAFILAALGFEAPRISLDGAVPLGTWAWVEENQSGEDQAVAVQVQWLTPGIPVLWKAEAGVQD